MKKITLRDCVEMADYLEERNIKPPKKVKKLYKKAKKNGYEEPEHFSRI